jgi:hypothetical protein
MTRGDRRQSTPDLDHIAVFFALVQLQAASHQQQHQHHSTAAECVGASSRPVKPLRTIGLTNNVDWFSISVNWRI